MTIRICSHRLSMQSDVFNDQPSLSNEIDCSPSLPTTLIYSGLKLHPKPLVPTISMPGMANPLSIVKKLSLSDSHGENPGKSLTTSLKHPSSPSSSNSSGSSIRLVTASTTGKSSPPTALQFQFLEKTTTTNGTFPTSKTYFLNPQQNSSTTNSPSLVTLIPPGTTSSKLQTLISSNNDLNSNNLNKSRLTLVQPLITTSSSTSTTTSTTSVTPKLVIQQNSASNLWSTQSTTKILSAKMLSHPVQLISSSEHSTLSSPTTTNDNSIFTSKTLDSGQQAFIHMSLLPPTSHSESMNSMSLNNFYSNPSTTVRLTTSRSMDHNNNHSMNTPIVREMTIEEKNNDSSSIKTPHPTKNSVKNRTRLPLQPSSQQISPIFPSVKKHKLPEDEQSSTSEPPQKLRHYDQFDSSINGKKIRKSRHHRTLTKISIENTTPSTSSIAVETSQILPTKKRSSAELAAAAILSSSHLRKKRIQKKTTLDSTTPINEIKIDFNHNNNDPSIEPINDELFKRLSQDFVHVDQRTGLRWIATKTRSQPMNSLLSRVSWKPKINHYEKYTDAIRMNSKRTVPVRSADMIRRRLSDPCASWRIDRLTTYLTDLSQDEQSNQQNLGDISQLIDQLNIGDPSIRHTMDDLIEDNLQRHRSFSEQLTQISSLLVQLLQHGETIKEIHSSSKSNNSILPRRTKER